MRGFAVWDDAGAKRPGILVFPEWVGVGEYTHACAQMLVSAVSSHLLSRRMMVECVDL